MLTTSSTADPIVIRRAYPDDTTALARLGQLDATRLPEDSYLVAEVDGELKAALGLDSGVSAADPFHPSGPLVRLLNLHADALRRREQRAKRAERRLRSLLPARKGIRHAPAHR
ncbi:MAG TPA: hypothetical protein VHR88_07020 [Solirubrobacteraceae bacterium]|nr:hypothetical protein [Solirubrobacteraceae bacterium]